MNIREVIEFHREAEDLCYLDCRATAGPLRSLRAGKGADAVFRASARNRVARWRLDQWRILCSRAADIRLYRWRPNGVGTGADGTSRAQKEQLSAFRHAGFWRPMDTLRDKIVLEEMWARPGRRPGKFGTE